MMPTPRTIPYPEGEMGPMNIMGYCSPDYVILIRQRDFENVIMVPSQLTLI